MKRKVPWAILNYLIVAALLLVSCTRDVSEEKETQAPQVEGNIIIVTSTDDSGFGTLRQVLQDAQSGDTITFDPAIFPPITPATIYVNSELPSINQGSLTIDASNAGVILDGSNIVGGFVPCLQIMSDWNIVQGVQIVNFKSGAGIVICEGAKNNRVGGNRNIGSGPIGQGNLVSNGDAGIGLWGDGTSFNTITGNLIGTDATGASDWGNKVHGIHIGESASNNIIGPDNIIAYNKEFGISIQHSNSFRNTITQNSIHDNEWGGIHLEEGGNAELSAPLILDFDLALGTITGIACPTYVIEVFSDSGNEGEVYEGKSTCDATGTFTFDKATAFSGPHLTAVATDTDGNTSEFSLPTLGIGKSIVLQEGNNLPRTKLQPKPSNELADNRMGGLWSGLWQLDGWQGILDTEIVDLGLKRVKLAINHIDVCSANWDVPEFSINPTYDDWITSTADSGVTITYILSFWDKAKRAEGGQVPCQRFKTDDDIERYLDFVRFTVHHFKDRVRYFELWNEPNLEDCGQAIQVEDYVDMVRQVAPVIRQAYPEAQIVVGSVTPLFEGPPFYSKSSLEYLFGILESDIMPLIDVVAWHIGGPSPEPEYECFGDYYYQYPSIVQEIKDIAAAHGFKGEFSADELNWRSPLVPHPYEPGVYSQTACAKYFARGIVRNLGMDLNVGCGGISSLRPIHYSTVQNLCTIMAGALPTTLSIEIRSEATNIRSYSFSLTNGDKLVALWTDGVVVDDDPGVEATLTFSGFSAQKVVGIDVLNGFEQELIANSEDGNLVINNLLVKDYPIMLRLTSW